LRAALEACWRENLQVHRHVLDDVEIQTAAHVEGRRRQFSTRNDGSDDGGDVAGPPDGSFDPVRRQRHRSRYGLQPYDLRRRKTLPLFVQIPKIRGRMTPAHVIRGQ